VKEHADGSRVFEVGYTEDGKKCFATTGPDLADALALRDRLMDEGKISRRARPAAKAA
jgi:hypothetical protein